MELCNIRGSLQQFKKLIVALSQKIHEFCKSVFSKKKFYSLRDSLQQLNKWNFVICETYIAELSLYLEKRYHFW